MRDLFSRRLTVLIAALILLPPAIAAVLASTSTGRPATSDVIVWLACNMILLSCGLALYAWRLAILVSRLESAEDRVRRDEEILHEVRATMAGITSASSLLDLPTSDLSPERHSRLTQLLGSEARRLERMLTPFPMEPMHREFLDDLITPLVQGEQALGRDVRWKPSGHPVVGRAGDIVEAVHALLTNAARHAPGAPVRIWSVRVGDMVEVHVSDHGPGIAPPLQHTLFERGTHAAGSPGDGLGLHVARRLVEDVGGTLRHNQTPSGTTFIMRLRAAHPTSGRIAS